MSAAAAYDPMEDGHGADPAPSYRYVRAQGGAFYSARYDLFIIGRYDEVVRAALDVESFSSRTPSTGLRRTVPAAESALEGGPSPYPPVATLHSADPPEHTLHRRIFNRVFSPRRTASYEPLVREVVEGLERGLPRSGRFELVEEYAVPLPIRVIATVLGMDDPKDAAALRQWSQALESMQNPGVPADEQATAAARIREWFDRVETEVRLRRGTHQDDLLSVLANEIDADGQHLGDAEIVSLATQGLVAGNETSTALIAAMFLYLATDSSLLCQLQHEPQLIGNFVDEVLRLSAPAEGLYRVTTREVAVDGTTIPKGAKVQLLWGSANRDPSQFTAPDLIDLGRGNSSSHLSFGIGRHRCPGAALSRMEAVITAETLLPRIEKLRLIDGDEPRWGRHFHHRGLDYLPLEVTTRPAGTR